MGRRSIIQTIFEVIRNFFSQQSHKQFTPEEVIFIALLILIILTAAILFGVFITKKRKKKEFQ